MIEWHRLIWINVSEHELHQLNKIQQRIIEKFRGHGKSQTATDLY